MDEENGLDAQAVLELRLGIAAERLGWGAVRIAAFREGFAAADPDRARLHRHDPDCGHREGDLDPGALDSLGYREGAAAREASLAPPSDLPGADGLVLLEQAEFWAGNGDGDFEPDEADWTCGAAGDLGRFLSVMAREEWISWFLDEHAQAVEAGRPGYAHLLLQDIRDPVVYAAYPDGRVDIWDGYHRVGAAMLKGAGTVPYLEGAPPGPAPSP
jgi:hypothetical protein